MKQRETHNKCMECDHEFTGVVALMGDGNWRHVIPGQKELHCPNCGGNYWKWLNYETEFAR